ncbi:hypothetical protein BLNAU_20266 [Blattamonas nauphoetae]|uniref:Uncharacterized protein n=1 Tax=Blattamonas nauphoetae TaxID=2049346 RepID=A0ABQ9WZQ5_9EUKA|nr:hypothetical protein BLNAU_20266 [Blattamonas nauphoetae]
MSALSMKTDTSSAPPSDLSFPQLSFPMDCSPFVNWNKEELESAEEWAIVFRSLVATVKSQPVLDDSLVSKAVKLLVYISPWKEESADAFLNILASKSDESPTNFVQYIVVLISSANQTITTTAMKMLDSLLKVCSSKDLIALVKADLIPQLIISLKPQSLSFAEAEDIHACLISSIHHSVWLATLDFLQDFEFEDDNEQQSLLETVLKQGVAPSEKYICRLCVSRYSRSDC